MCDGCNCSCPSPPSSSSAGNPVAPCANSNSEILVLDEIGLPFANTRVNITVSGRAHTATTDAQGKICLRLAPGTAVRVELSNTHESRSGDSTTTPSGRHFSAGGRGP